MRFLALLWGLVGYVVFWAALLWSIVFLGYHIMPKKYHEQIYTALPWIADGETAGGVDIAYSVNGGLLAGFIVVNALLSWWGACACSKTVGRPAARSTQIIVSGLLLGLLYWKWLPAPEFVWELPQHKTLMQSLFWAGWALALLGTFMMGHFEFTGLRQAFLYFRGREYTTLPATGLAAAGRHVLLLGLLMGLLVTPKMTLAHLMFGLPMALYVVIRWFLASKKPELATAPSTAPAAA